MGSDVLVRALISNGRATHEPNRRARQRRPRTPRSTPRPRSSRPRPVAAQPRRRAGRRTRIRPGDRRHRAGGRLRRRDRLPTASTWRKHSTIWAAPSRGAGGHDDARESAGAEPPAEGKALAETDVAIARTLEEIWAGAAAQGGIRPSGAALRRAAAIQEASSVDHPAYVIDAESDRAATLVRRSVCSSPGTHRNGRWKSPNARCDPITPPSPNRSVILPRPWPILETSTGPWHCTSARWASPNGTSARTITMTGDVSALARAYAGVTRWERTRRAAAFPACPEQSSKRDTDLGTSTSRPPSRCSRRADASLGDSAERRARTVSAEAIHTRVGGPNHPFVAVALTELAKVYREQGSPVQALRHYERALAIREKGLRPNHRDVARTLADMASTLMQVGRSARAQQVASRALAIWQQLDAPDAPDYATALAAVRGDPGEPRGLPGGERLLREGAADQGQVYRHVASGVR